MPVFEFRCSACEHDFEKLMFSRGASVSCPQCGSAEIVKRPSTFGTSGLERNVSSSASACSGCSSGSCSGCSHG